MHDRVIRILLIEDEPGHSQLIQRAIKNAMAESHMAWAATLADGLERLGSESFDVVLADLSLPDASGCEGVKAIRHQSPTVPIVVLTLLEDPQVEVEALNCGAQDYLPKHLVSPEFLDRAIQHAIQRQENATKVAELLASLRAGEQQLRWQKTLLKKKNRRLKQLYETAQRFVDNVSHEFRTPLTVIMDYVSLVREGTCGEVNEEQAHMLDVAAVRVDDLNTMVDDMLDVSKLEAGMLGAWRRTCQLPEIVEAVAGPLRQKAAVRKVAFAIEVPHDLPEVYCDAEKIGRVIVNLVVNAIKFCGEAGDIRLTARADMQAKEVVVSVADNGPGIGPDDLERIFDRFKQLNSNVRQSTKGFGLGLNIAQELVGLSLGTMRVESQLGHGSTFIFSIPLAEAPEVAKRYLNRIRATRKIPPSISLFSVRVEPLTLPEDADDIDAFLTGLLRQNDLVWRQDTHNWLIVIAAAEVDRYVERIKAEREKIDRHRPAGPLPGFQMALERTWCANDSFESLLDYFDAKCVGQETAAC